MKQNLFPHNQNAYEKVMKAFETKDRAAIVHATGTGKSYVIGAVVDNFNRACVIAPNNFVLDETRKVCKRGTQMRTYADVNLHPEGQYDLIVLDEFHRAGAISWGERVKQLIDANPGVKVLGTSATNIRYLDNNRDMAEELFEGNVVSRLSLKDAIDRKIIPNPVYVNSLYEIDTTIERLMDRVEGCTLTIENKKQVIDEIRQLSNSWSMSYGVSKVIKKYISQDIRRIIVFSNSVSNSKEAKRLVAEWFEEAGFETPKFYIIDYKHSNVQKQLAAFQKDNDDRLKIAISVNMLNEGVHIEDVDSVIMLRSTESRIIAEQQIGRCLTARNSDKRPVILDLVNNLKLISSRLFTEAGVEGSRCEYEKQNNEAGMDSPFEIIDECVDIRQFVDNVIGRTTYGEGDEVSSEFHAFVARENRLPKYTDEGAIQIYRLMTKVASIKQYRDRYPVVWETMERFGYTPLSSKRESQKKEFLDWLDENHRLPKSNHNHEGVEYVMSIRLRSYSVNKSDKKWLEEELAKRGLSFKMDGKNHDDERKERMEFTINYLKENHRNPRKDEPGYIKFSNYVNELKRKGDEVQIDYLESLGARIRVSHADMQIIEYARNVRKDMEQEEYASEKISKWCTRFDKKLKDGEISQCVIDTLTAEGIIDEDGIIRTYRTKSVAGRLQKFYDENGRIPNPGEELYTRVRSASNCIKNGAREDLYGLLPLCEKLGLLLPESSGETSAIRTLKGLIDTIKSKGEIPVYVPKDRDYSNFRIWRIRYNKNEKMTANILKVIEGSFLKDLFLLDNKQLQDKQLIQQIIENHE